MAESDEWLMSQIKQGSPHSLDPIIRRHAPALLTFAARYLPKERFAAPALLEICEAVWKQRRTYAYPRPFRPWLFRIALNKCRELTRNLPYRQWRQQAEHDEIASPSASPPATSNAGGDVQNAIAQLPEEPRAVLILHVFNAMHYSEIADTLNLHETTIRALMHEGLAKFRRAMESPPT